MYLRRGTKSRVMMVDIVRVATVLGSEVCSLLPGLHAWTGCDTVSALANQGKIKALKIVQQHQIYISLGTLSFYQFTTPSLANVNRISC